MRTIMKYTGIKIGVLVGLICALISLVLFSIIESVGMTLQKDNTLSFGSIFSLVFPLTLMFGGAYSFIPSGFGGYVLELLIRNRLKKGLLTEKWAAISGVLVAGVAIMLICGFGVFIMTPTHDGKHLFDYINDLSKRAISLLREVIIVTVLACTSGGFAGKYLARKIKGSQVEAV